MINGKLIIKDNNPFSWNSIVAKKMEEKEEKTVKLTPTAESLLQNPSANIIGKWLGIDTKREWGQQYDKVDYLYNWAKDKANSDDPQYLILLLKDKWNTCAQMSDRKINDLYIACKLEAKGD